MLRGTIRDHADRAAPGRSCASTPARRTCPRVPDAPLPEAVVAGEEPFLVVGAIAGG